jgi:hypothetical protein
MRELLGLKLSKFRPITTSDGIFDIYQTEEISLNKRICQLYLSWFLLP